MKLFCSYHLNLILKSFVINQHLRKMLWDFKLKYDFRLRTGVDLTNRQVSGRLGPRGIRGPRLIFAKHTNAPVCICVMESVTCLLTTQNGEF